MHGGPATMMSVHPPRQWAEEPLQRRGLPSQEVPDIPAEVLVADLPREGAAARPVPLHRRSAMVLPFREARGHEGRPHPQRLHQLAEDEPRQPGAVEQRQEREGSPLARRRLGWRAWGPPTHRGRRSSGPSSRIHALPAAASYLMRSRLAQFSIASWHISAVRPHAASCGTTAARSAPCGSVPPPAPIASYTTSRGLRCETSPSSSTSIPCACAPCRGSRPAPAAGRGGPPSAPPGAGWHRGTPSPASALLHSARPPPPAG